MNMTRRNAPHRISPSMSLTLHFHFLPSSPSHSFTLSTLLAMDSTSLVVSSLPIAAKMSRPLPMVEIRLPSTVTDADLTLCMTAGDGQLPIDGSLMVWSCCLTLHVVKRRVAGWRRDWARASTYLGYVLCRIARS
jgi:hypothetical protein